VWSETAPCSTTILQNCVCRRPACGVKVATNSISAHSDTWWSDERTNLTIRAGAIGDNMMIKCIGWVQVCVRLHSCLVQSLYKFSKTLCTRTVTLRNHKFLVALCTSQSLCRRGEHRHFPPYFLFTAQTGKCAVELQNCVGKWIAYTVVFKDPDSCT